MVSNKVYQAPDYFSFIKDISKQWKKENNSDIAFEFGLDKNVLPALVRLTRDFDITFNSISKTLEEKEKYIKKLLSDIEVLQNIDYETQISDLKNQIQDLKNQRDEAEEAFTNLREEMYEMPPKKTFLGIG